MVQILLFILFFSISGFAVTDWEQQMYPSAQRRNCLKDRLNQGDVCYNRFFNCISTNFLENLESESLIVAEAVKCGARNYEIFILPKLNFDPDLSLKENCKKYDDSSTWFASSCLEELFGTEDNGYGPLVFVKNQANTFYEYSLYYAIRTNSTKGIIKVSYVVDDDYGYYELVQQNCFFNNKNNCWKDKYKLKIISLDSAPAFVKGEGGDIKPIKIDLIYRALYLGVITIPGYGQYILVGID